MSEWRTNRRTKRVFPTSTTTASFEAYEPSPGAIRLAGVRRRDASIMETKEKHSDPIEVVNEIAHIFREEYGDYSGAVFDNLEWFDVDGNDVDEPLPNGQIYNFSVLLHTPSDGKNWSIDGAVSFKRGVWVGSAEVEEEIIQ